MRTIKLKLETYDKKVLVASLAALISMVTRVGGIEEVVRLDALLSLHEKFHRQLFRDGAVKITITEALYLDAALTFLEMNFGINEERLARGIREEMVKQVDKMSGKINVAISEIKS